MLLDLIVYLSVALVFMFSGFVWWLDSKFKFICGALVLILINELIRVYPAYIYDYMHNGNLIPYSLFLLSVFSLIAGGIAATTLFPRVGGSLYYSNCPFTYSRSDLYLFYAVVILVLISVLPSLFLYKGLSPVVEGLFDRFSLNSYSIDYISVGDMRKEVTKGHVFGGEYRGQGVIRAFNKVCWPFLLVISLVGGIVTKKKKWFFLAAVVGFLTFNFLTSDGTRGAFLNVLVLLFVLFSFVFKLKLRHVIASVVFIFLVATLVSLFSPKLGNVERDSFYSVAISKISQRILMGNSINDIYAINFKEEGVLKHREGGIHLRDIRAALPGIGGGKPFAHELFVTMNPGSAKTTFSTGTYLTKLYMDFDILGVGIGFLMIGFFSVLVQAVLFSSRKTILSFSVSVFVVFLLGQLVLSGAVSLLVNVTILSVIITLLLVFQKSLFQLSNIRS